MAYYSYAPPAQHFSPETRYVTPPVYVTPLMYPGPAPIYPGHVPLHGYYTQPMPEPRPSRHSLPAPSSPPRKHRSHKQSPQLHHLLQFHFEGEVPLCFDLSAPLNALVHGDHTQLSNRTLSKPATEPKVQVMHLKCKELPWPVIVEALPGRYVTVGDVANTLHGWLRHPLSPSEAFIAKPYDVEAANRQANRRIRQYPTQSETMTLRVDWLEDKSMFLGLTPSPTKAAWKIHLGYR